MHNTSDVDVYFQVPFEGAISTKIFLLEMSFIKFSSALANS